MSVARGDMRRIGNESSTSSVLLVRSLVDFRAARRTSTLDPCCWLGALELLSLFLSSSGFGDGSLTFFQGRKLILRRAGLRASTSLLVPLGSLG